MRRREHHHRKLHPELGLALSSLALTRTAPEAHGGQPGGGRWSVRFLPLFSPTNFNVWWGFLPEAGILLRPPVSFPGGGRRVLNPEERPGV